MVKIDKEKMDHTSTPSHKERHRHREDCHSDSDGDDPDFDPETSKEDTRTTRSSGRRVSNDSSIFNGRRFETRNRTKARQLADSSDEEEDECTDEESDSRDESEDEDETMDDEHDRTDMIEDSNDNDNENENENDTNAENVEVSERRATRERRQKYPSYNEKWIAESVKYEPSSRSSRRRRLSHSPEDSMSVRKQSSSFQADQDTPSRRSSRRFKEPSDNEDNSRNGPSRNKSNENNFDENSQQIEEDAEARRSTRRNIQIAAGDSSDIQGDMYSRLKGSQSRRKERVDYRQFLRATVTTVVRNDHSSHRGRLENGIDAEPVSRRLRERKSRDQPGRDMNGPRRSMDATLFNKVRKNRIRRKRRRSSSSRSGGSRSSSSSSASSVDVRRGNRSRSNPFDKLAKAGSKKEFQDLQPNEIDPSIRFESMGGLDHVIQKLQETVVLPLVYKEFYSARNITPPKGILFHGPPGTGKTMLARALANECSTLGGQKVTFFIRKGGDLLSKWVGESERQIRKLFEQASISQPSIIFFDEIDGLAPIRSSKTDQVHNSVVSTLLAELDGVKDRGDIIIIGATNRIDSIDSALRRPGRFDHEFTFLLPTLEGRAQILKSHTSKWKGDEVCEKVIEEVAARTVGFSGADLKLLCAEASVFALQRRYPQIYTSTNKYLLDYNSIKVEPVDWIQAMRKIKPSSTRSLNSILITGHPLPKAVVPLLQHEVVEISKRIASMFPLIECPEFMREPAPKRFLVCARHHDNGLDQYIVPAVLHRFESVPVFTLSLESVVLQDANQENSAIARVFNEAERVNKLAVILIPSFNILLGSMTLQGQTLLCERIMNATSKPIFILATAQLEQKEKSLSVNDQNPSDGEDNSDREASADIPARFLTFFNGRSYTLSHVPHETRTAFFQPLLTHQALLVQVEPDTGSEPLEELPLAPPPPPKVLSQDQLKHKQKKETSMLRHLRKFLREMLWRLFRNKKFQDFIRPIDKNEVPDYYDIIKKPMTLETMVVKLNQGLYLSARDLLEDIHLIRDNAVAYNPSTPEGLSIISRSEELVDYANLIIEDEMDSDFEDACQKIASERNIVPVPTSDVKVETSVAENCNANEEQKTSSKNSNNSAPASVSPDPELSELENPNYNSNLSQPSAKTNNRKRKLRRKGANASKQRKVSTSDLVSTSTPTQAAGSNAGDQDKGRQVSRSPASNASSSCGSQASKRSHDQTIAHETSPSSSLSFHSRPDLDSFNPSFESAWSPNNCKLRKCTNFEAYGKRMKKLVCEAANATEGLGVNRILDLRYKLLLLIERHYGEDNKEELIAKVQGTIKCFQDTENELRRDSNGIDMEAETESR